MICVRLAARTDLAAIAAAQGDRDLTYPDVGATAGGSLPDGYQHGKWSVALGQGQATFDRAADALSRFEPQRGSGIVVETTGPLEHGTDVAQAVPLLGLRLIATCRVLDVVREPDRFGFAYGTLPIHPESGEERFTVTLGLDGTVTFHVVVFWRGGDRLTRLGTPVAKVFQRRATAEYLRAMQRAVNRPAA